MTGGRLKRVREYLDDERFCFTYGDGVADVDIGALHRLPPAQGRAGDAHRGAAARALRRAGPARATRVTPFRGEAAGRRRLDQRRLLRARARSARPDRGRPHGLGARAAGALAREGQLSAFAHHGFWQPMDTLRDKIKLEELWAQATRRGRCGHDAADDDLSRLFGGAYRGRRVLVTGHTGFKGSWLALWLQQLGARVSGLALPADAHPNHSRLLGLAVRRGAGRPARCVHGARRAAPLRARAGVPPGGAAAGAAQLPRARGHLRHQRHGPGEPARSRARHAERAGRRQRHHRQVLSESRNPAPPSARTTRSAATTPTARRRPAPNWSRPAGANRSCRKTMAVAMRWRWPRRAPATSSAAATGARIA